MHQHPRKTFLESVADLYGRELLDHCKFIYENHGVGHKAFAEFFPLFEAVIKTHLKATNVRYYFNVNPRTAHSKNSWCNLDSPDDVEEKPLDVHTRELIAFVNDEVLAGNIPAWFASNVIALNAYACALSMMRPNRPDLRAFAVTTLCNHLANFWDGHRALLLTPEFLNDYFIKRDIYFH